MKLNRLAEILIRGLVLRCNTNLKLQFGIPDLGSSLVLGWESWSHKTTRLFRCTTSAPYW